MLKYSFPSHKSQPPYELVIDFCKAEGIWVAKQAWGLHIIFYFGSKRDMFTMIEKRALSIEREIKILLP